MDTEWKELRLREEVIRPEDDLDDRVDQLPEACFLVAVGDERLHPETHAPEELPVIELEYPFFLLVRHDLLQMQSHSPDKPEADEIRRFQVDPQQLDVAIDDERYLLVVTPCQGLGDGRESNEGLLKDEVEMGG